MFLADKNIKIVLDTAFLIQCLKLFKLPRAKAFKHPTALGI
jgi:hypothetical protein